MIDYSFGETDIHSCRAGIAGGALRPQVPHGGEADRKQGNGQRCLAM